MKLLGICKVSLFATLAVWSSHAALGEIPQLIQYQGKATEKVTGLPLTGNHNITFRIYDSPTTPTHLWQEQHLNVPVSNGNFSVLLGSQTALDLPFDRPYWLTVDIDGDGEMAPRSRLVSVPYAYTATKAIQADRATTATNLAVSPMPRGGIIMWSGSIASIPQGWTLCDGTNGAPDLRDRFIVGARQDQGGIAKTNVKNVLMQAGGEHEHTLTVAEIAAHTHSVGAIPGSWGCYQAGNVRDQPGQSGSTGGNQPHENCPPFYASAFIMKL